jgi:hypothetical protein
VPIGRDMVFGRYLANCLGEIALGLNGNGAEPSESLADIIASVQTPILWLLMDASRCRSWLLP